MLEITLLQDMSPTIPPQAEVYSGWQVGRLLKPKGLAAQSGPGQHELKVTKDGFKPYVGQVHVAAGKTEKTAVKLEPASKENWTSLFDGKSLRGWTAFKGDTSGWTIPERHPNKEGRFRHAVQRARRLPQFSATHRDTAWPKQ